MIPESIWANTQQVLSNLRKNVKGIYSGKGKKACRRILQKRRYDTKHLTLRTNCTVLQNATLWTERKYVTKHLTLRTIFLDATLEQTWRVAGKKRVVLIPCSRDYRERCDDHGDFVYWTLGSFVSVHPWWYFHPPVHPSARSFPAAAYMPHALLLLHTLR